MDVYIHFKSLPQDKTLEEIENGLFDAMDGKGIVNGGSFDGTGGAGASGRGRQREPQVRTAGREGLSPADAVPEGYAY